MLCDKTWPTVSLLIHPKGVCWGWDQALCSPVKVFHIIKYADIHILLAISFRSLSLFFKNHIITFSAGDFVKKKKTFWF